MIKVRVYAYTPDRMAANRGLLESESLPPELRPDPIPVVVPNRRDRRDRARGLGGRR